VNAHPVLTLDLVIAEETRFLSGDLADCAVRENILDGAVIMDDWLVVVGRDPADPAR